MESSRGRVGDGARRDRSAINDMERTRGWFAVEGELMLCSKAVIDEERVGTTVEECMSVDGVGANGEGDRKDEVFFRVDYGREVEHGGSWEVSILLVTGLH